MLTQEKYIALSAQENIGFGNASNMNDMTSIRKAATESGAHDYIRSFESFYKTSLHMEYNSSDMPYDNYYDYTNDDTKEDPFIVKVLDEDLYDKAKFEDKRIIWYPKPEKKAINIKIPEYKPSQVSESVSWRALSGGQWQRIALARAFMKIQEADLLILDEPSSALDPQAEYQVFKTIMELRKNKTTLFIVSPFLTFTKFSRIGFIPFVLLPRFWYAFSNCI